MEHRDGVGVWCAVSRSLIDTRYSSCVTTTTSTAASMVLGRLQSTIICDLHEV